MAAWKNRKVLRKGRSSSGGDASDYGQTSEVDADVPRGRRHVYVSGLRPIQWRTNLPLQSEYQNRAKATCRRHCVQTVWTR